MAVKMMSIENKTRKRFTFIIFIIICGLLVLNIISFQLYVQSVLFLISLTILKATYKNQNEHLNMVILYIPYCYSLCLIFLDSMENHTIEVNPVYIFIGSIIFIISIYLIRKDYKSILFLTHIVNQNDKEPKRYLLNIARLISLCFLEEMVYKVIFLGKIAEDMNHIYAILLVLILFNIHHYLSGLYVKISVKNILQLSTLSISTSLIYLGTGNYIITVLFHIIFNSGQIVSEVMLLIKATVKEK